MSQTLIRPSNRVLFIPEKQAAKPLTRRFKVVSDYQPSGDQPTAIAELVAGVQQNERDQVLLGVTGSGKTSSRRWTSTTWPGARRSPRTSA